MRKGCSSAVYLPTIVLLPLLPQNFREVKIVLKGQQTS